MSFSNKNCRICNNDIEPFMDFGQMPIANGFINKIDFNDEYFYEMEVSVCQNCHMFQLLDQPQKEKMFNENYAFFTHTSTNMLGHFKDLAEEIYQRFLIHNNKAFVVEIGSNDGSTLKNFAEKNIKHLGVEPSKNVAEYAINNSVNTIIDFFDKDTAKEINKYNGKADVIFAANVMCHIPYIRSIIEGVQILLKENGVFIFEDPYLCDVLKNTTYDQIYDEHYFLFSITSLNYLFDQFDMEIIKVKNLSTHGGSMRYYVAKKNNFSVDSSVKEALLIENELQINNIKTYEKFKNNCRIYKKNLIELLETLRKEGKIVSGYAATSKSTTILNYCNLDYNHINTIFDTTSIKIGKYSPGTHIPIKDHAQLRDNYPDYLLLFAYNHKEEIFNKEKDFVEKGGKWITYFPDIKII